MGKYYYNIPKTRLKGSTFYLFFGARQKKLSTYQKRTRKELSGSYHHKSLDLGTNFKVVNYDIVRCFTIQMEQVTSVENDSFRSYEF